MGPWTCTVLLMVAGWQSVFFLDGHSSVANSVTRAEALYAKRDDLDRVRGIALVADQDETPARRRQGMFQLEIAALSQSARLVREELRMQSEFAPLLWLWLREPEYRRRSLESRTAVIDALAAGDPAEARDRTVGHVSAAIDWLLETTTVLHVTDDIADIAEPLDRLHALLRMEMDRLSREPRRIRVFFDFWAMGIRHAAIRSKMRRELARYREAFRPIAAEVLASEPARFPGVSAKGLAAVAVSFIKGCAVQAMIDPEHFDIEEYLVAAQGLVGQLAPAVSAR